MFGFTLALLVCVGMLWVAVGISRALFGNLGTGLLLAVFIVTAALMGWSALIHSDSLAVQMLGWGMVGPTVWGLLKTGQILTRKVRAELVKDETV